MDQESPNKSVSSPGIVIVTAQVRAVTIGFGFSIQVKRNHGNEGNEAVTILRLFLPRCQHEVRENRSSTLRIDFNEQRNGRWWSWYGHASVTSNEADRRPR